MRLDAAYHYRKRLANNVHIVNEGNEGTSSSSSEFFWKPSGRENHCQSAVGKLRQGRGCKIAASLKKFLLGPQHRTSERDEDVLSEYWGSFITNLFIDSKERDVELVRMTSLRKRLPDLAAG